MNMVLQRIADATGTRTQTGLAEILGIKQSSISDAKRRNSVPDAWLVTLLKKYRLNPDWILTGQGEKYLVPSASILIESPSNPAAGSPLENLFHQIMEAVEIARDKHSYLGHSIEQARRAVESEHKEWEAQALLIENPNGTVNHQRLEKAHKEGLDCIATHIRFLIGDVIGLP